MNPTDAQLDAAQQYIEDRFVKDPTKQPHSVSRGFIKEKGRRTGEVGIIVKVADKRPLSSLAEDDILPREINGVRIDVQQAPVPHDQRHWTNRPEPLGFAAFGPTGTHRSCLQCPIPGGAQIAPNKPWVGTLSCALRFLPSPSASEPIYGALTNAHVTGMRSEGQPMYQPQGGKGEPFGKVVRVVSLHFGTNKPCYIDAALIDTFRNDGPYLEIARKRGWPGIHTVINKQIEVGQINPQPADPQLGMQVRKTGRTTGTVTAECVEVKGTTYVAYDEGQVFFKEQATFENPREQFSAGGDSGSLIMTMDNRPVALLFAGGGNQTIGSPIKFVLDWCKGAFY